MYQATITGGHMLYVVIRTHNVPKNHVFDNVYTPYLVLIIMFPPELSIAARNIDA